MMSSSSKEFFSNLHMTLVEPEIPGNVGTLLRLQQCWGFSFHLVGPLGFLLSSPHFRRAHLDYHQGSFEDPSYVPGSRCFHKTWHHYVSFFQQPAQKEKKGNPRFLLLSPQGSTFFQSFTFLPGDHLIFGSESKGLPQEFFPDVHHVLKIPMKPPCRSLNLALCAAMVMAKAMDVTEQWP